MGEILQTNIFFFITATSVIILTIFLAIVLYHVLRIVQVIRRIVERVESGSEVLLDDFQHIRGMVSGTSTMLTHLLGLKSVLRSDGDTKPKGKRKPTKLTITDEA
jgi:uncharacterized protein YqhQ